MSDTTRPVLTIDVICAAIIAAAEHHDAQDYKGALDAIAATRTGLNLWERQLSDLIDGASVETWSNQEGRPAGQEPEHEIIETTRGALDVSYEGFHGDSRHSTAVLAREIAVLLLRERTHHSYPEIAVLMHRPNHSTVISAHKRVATVLMGGKNPGLSHRVDEIRKALDRKKVTNAA